MLHDVLAAVRHGCSVAELGYRALPSGERHLRSPERLAALYHPTLLKETVRIASQCHFRMDQLRYQYPREVVPKGKTATEWLRELTEAGIRDRWPGGVDAGLRAQIEHELELIASLGLRR